MEKKQGDVLNQLAMISDLIEKVNLNPISATIIFNLEVNEFDSIFQMIQKKYDKKMDQPKDTFSISIGMVDILFNKNSA